MAAKQAPAPLFQDSRNPLMIHQRPALVKPFGTAAPRPGRAIREWPAGAIPTGHSLDSSMPVPYFRRSIFLTLAKLPDAIRTR